MIKDEKYIKDTSSVLDLALKDKVLPSISYTKTNKLITALYMVTDTMDTQEPMRLKLRALGVEILSDIVLLDKKNIHHLDEKITAILSFLNITSDLGMISSMNSNILKKEFTELKQSIQEFEMHDQLWLEEFSVQPARINSSIGHNVEDENSEINHQLNMSLNKGQSTRIGVQKGSTLMKALNNVGDGSVHNMSHSNRSGSPRTLTNNDFEILKHKRREEILKIVRNQPTGVSIKDIGIAVRNLGDALGEKTLQRELVSMVHDNVLKKTGEKRWSRYFLS